MTAQSLLSLNIGACVIMVGILLLGGLIGWHLKKLQIRRQAHFALQYRHNYWVGSYERLAKLEADHIQLLLENARAKAGVL